MIDMEAYDEPDPDSDLDYEETFNKRSKRRKGTGRVSLTIILRNCVLVFHVSFMKSYWNSFFIYIKSHLFTHKFCIISHTFCTVICFKIHWFYLIGDVDKIYLHEIELILLLMIFQYLIRCKTVLTDIDTLYVLQNR